MSVSKKQHLKLRLTVPPDHQDAIIGALFNMGFTGFEQDEEVLDAWIPAEKFTSQVDKRLQQWLAGIKVECRVDGRQLIPDRNWNEEWEKTIKPQVIGRFYIHPTWSTESPPSGSIPVCIDPKMAFGTGYHETTRLVLKLLPEYMPAGGRVLDVGTGTGILAIASIKLGAGKALGLDIDPWSYDNALDNASGNHVGDQLDVRTGSVEVIATDERFDLILANINRNTLLEMGDKFLKMLSRQGHMIISGILAGDEEDILKHTAYRTLKHRTTNQENEWIAMAFQRDSSL